MFKKNRMSALWSILSVFGLLLPISAVSQAASISGTVKDVNGDPIGNVDVWACTGQCRDDDWFADGLSSADNGRYTITGLTAGAEYKIKFFTTNVPGYVAEWYNDKSGRASADPVTATSAGAAADAELEFASDVTGAVKDINGNPVAGVMVYAYAAGVGDEWVSNATTTDTFDASGNNYTLSGLSASVDYHIYFDTENLTSVSYPGEWYDNQPDDGSLTAPVSAARVNGGAGRIDAILGESSSDSDFSWLIFIPAFIRRL